MGFDIYGKWTRPDGAVLDDALVTDFGRCPALFEAMGFHPWAGDRPNVVRFPQADPAAYRLGEYGMRGSIRLSDFEAYDYAGEAWQELRPVAFEGLQPLSGQTRYLREVVLPQVRAWAGDGDAVFEYGIA